MGVASITPAFPRIARELDLDSRQVGLLISVFTFPGIVLVPVLGFLSDRVGRKAVLVPALLLFAAAYDGDSRKAAVGYNAGALSIGTAAYPVLGGRRSFSLERRYRWPTSLSRH